MRKMSATSSAGLPINRCLAVGSASGANRLCVRDLLDLGYGLRHQVKRAARRTNGFPRNVRVAGGRPQAAMTEQDLDDADVGAGFQEMGGKGMPQGPDRRSLGQTGGNAGFDANLEDPSGSE